MNELKTKLNIKSWLSKYRFPIIASRELNKIATLPKIVIMLFAAIIIPLLFADIADVKNYPLDIQALMLRDSLFFLTYIWLGGILLAFFATWTISDFVAGQDNRGTLLSLITKPIHRWEVILGKYLAYMIFIALIEVIALFITIYVLVTVSGSHLSVIWGLTKYIPILLLYCMFVALVFGTIPLVLSTVSRSRVLVVIITAGIVIVMFLGFYIIRSGSSNYYEDSHLYNLDLGYHLGNVFMSFAGAGNIQLTPTFQEQMGLFAGTHDLGVSLGESDQGFQLASIPLTNYYPKLVSWILWTLIPIGLTVLSVFKLKKKEVQ